MSDTRHSDPFEPTTELGRPLQVQATGVKAGTALGGRFQIEAVIGEGGSGQVFRAWDRVLGEPVALKILRPDRAQDKAWIRRLAREAKVARAIRHPNVCRVFDLGHLDGHWFVSMELASGGTLRDTLRAAAERPLSEVLADVRAVCAGLAAIHTVGFIHRDVTPQNVLRMTDGRLVLSDFGLAIEGTDTTVHGGTPSYMSPEAALGLRPDQRSDVWQLGVILHELLFRRRPDWQAARSGVILREPAGPGASGFERQLGRLCAACLAQNPADRPPNAMAVSAQLAALELGSPRIALRQLLRERPAFLVISGVLVGGLIWAGVAHRSERRAVERSVPPGMTAADRRFLRSLAEEMKVQGRLNEAGSLNRLAGLPASP